MVLTIPGPSSVPIEALASLRIAEDTNKIVADGTSSPGARAQLTISRLMPDGYARYDIDPRGDAWVCVDLGNIKLDLPGLWTEESPTWAFRVCSRTLARCSPVFAAHLFPENGSSGPARSSPRAAHKIIVRLPATEDNCVGKNGSSGPARSSPRATNQTIVRLPANEDNCVGMAVLLCIMHDHPTDRFFPLKHVSDSEAERKKVRIIHLHRALELSLKFDCLNTLRSKFLALSRDLKSGESIKDCEDFHRVAWMAGTVKSTTLLKHCIWAILRHFSAAEDAMVVDDGTVSIEMLEFQDLVHQKRMAIVNQLVEIILSYPVMKAINNPADYESLCSCDPTICNNNQERQACGAFLVGQAALALNNNGLWPLPGEDCMDISVNMLAEITWVLRELNENKGLPVVQPSGGNVHGKCSVCDIAGLDAKMGRIADQIWLETVGEAKEIFSKRVKLEEKTLAWD